MGVATQRAVLDAIGVDWYVRRELVVDAPAAVAFTEQPAEVAVQAPVVSRSAAPANLAALVDDKPAEPAAVAVEKPVSEPALKAVLEPDVQVEKLPKVEEAPFNWLVAECGPVQFVCDIKQAKLNGVWHAAAIELLADIAKAMRAKASLTSRYFNWPIVGPNGVPLQDVELDGFLEAFLELNEESPICILMGATAQSLASPLLVDKGRVVHSVTLGELFTKPENKKALWQQLKPLLTE